ncbi:MAG: hypothetical protein C5B58_02265 [Acidobacteria bacterium]|nr:MAG: hypothetical protein C5B58_02265 [Acidobacteriota bacterium]
MRPDNSALLIVAHGSTVNPDSSAPTLAHAAEIRRRNIFAQVECGFWKEEPSLRDALFLFDPEWIREVYVVPNFQLKLARNKSLREISFADGSG